MNVDIAVLNGLFSQYEETGGAITEDSQVSYILGGEAHFSLENTKTGNRFVYRVKKHKTMKMWFVSVPFEFGAWGYAGNITLRGRDYVYSQGNKGIFNEQEPFIRALLWLLNLKTPLPEYVKVTHSGKCSICRRRLTDSESIARGIGPECYKKVKKGI